MLHEASEGDCDRWQRRRSYSAQLLDRKTAVGGALLLEIERILQGKKEAVWGVLNYIREQSSGHPAFLSPASNTNMAEEAAQRAAVAMEARTEAYEQAMAAAARSRNSGPTFKEQQQGGKIASQAELPHTPRSPCRLPAGTYKKLSSTQPPALQQPFVRGGPAEDYGLTGVIPSGVGPLTMAVGPRNLSPCRKLQLLELEKAEFERRRGLQQSLASAEAQLLQQQEGTSAQEGTTSRYSACKAFLTHLINKNIECAAAQCISDQGALPTWLVFWKCLKLSLSLVIVQIRLIHVHHASLLHHC
jgi:hypothetical protein